MVSPVIAAFAWRDVACPFSRCLREPCSMHSRLSRVLLSCRCLYGPLEAAQAWLCGEQFCKGALRAHLVPRNAVTQSHQSFDGKTRGLTIAAAPELGSKQDSSMHRQ